MPTIHLSVPEKYYEKLKRAAETYNIQVTDLIKIFIRMNIDDALEGRLTPASRGTDASKLEERIGQLERELKERIEALEHAVKTLSEIMMEHDDRLGKLEMDVEELKEAAEMSNVVIDAELLENRR